MILAACWLVQQPSGSSVLSEHVWILLCSFGIVLCCLQVALQLLPSMLSYLFIVGIVVIVAAAIAESSFSCWSPTADLSGSSILDCTCWSRGCSTSISCWYSWLTHFTRRQNCYQSWPPPQKSQDEFVCIELTMADSCHIYSVSFLYIFYYTFNTTWVFFFYVYTEIRSRVKIREKSWKSGKLMIAAIYFKIQIFRDIKDLPIKIAQYMQVSTKIWVQI